MYVKQISVFMENKVGKLGDITAILRAENIDVRAFSIADTTEFGILRLMVKEPDRAVKVLRDAGMTAQTNEVIVVPMSDKTGALDEIVRPICEAGIDIKYLYSFLGKNEGSGSVAICAGDMKKALEVLKNNNFEISDCTEI